MFSLIPLPAWGTLTGIAPNFTYAAGRSTGTDTIHFSVTDGEFTSSGTVTITVTGKNSTDDGGGGSDGGGGGGEGKKK